MAEPLVDRQDPASEDPSTTDAGPPPRPPWPVAPRTVAVLATILAGALALFRLGHKSYWLDEGYSLGHAGLGWGDFWEVLVQREPNGALHAVLLWGWLRLGDAEWWARLPSAAFAVATVPLLYLLLRRLFDDRVGAVGAVLLALNGFSLRFAQEARTYSLLMLVTTASVLLFVAYVQDRRTGRWWAWVAVTALLPYVHVFGWLVIAVEATAVVARRGLPRPPGRRLLLGLAVPVLVGLPVALALLAGNDEGQASGIPGVTPVRFVGVYARVSGDLGVVLLAVVGALWAWTVLQVAAAARRRRWRLDEAGWGVTVLVAWLVVPPVLVALGSPVQPLFGARYFVLLVPAASGLTAAALCRLQRPALRRGLAVAVVLLTAAGAVAWYARPAVDDLRSTADLLAENAQPGDAVVFFPWFMKLPLDPYAEDRPAVEAIETDWPLADWGEFLPDHADHPDEDALRAAATHSRVWIVARDDRTAEDDADIAALEALLAGTHTEVLRADPAGLDVWLYARESSS